MRSLDRRQALALLLSMPLAKRAEAVERAQTTATAKHRVTFRQGHGLLIEPDGTVQIWHTAKQFDRLDAVLGLGPGGTLAPYTLARVPGLAGVVAAAVGPSCSFALRADGTIVAWGTNGGNGRLGTTLPSLFETVASWGPDANVPSPLAVPFEAVDVSVMNDHALALTRDGRVFGWGTGDKGQLGSMPPIKFRTRSSSTMPYVPYPIEIVGLSDVTAIAAGYTHSLALLKDGTVRAWGENRWGEIGDGTTTRRNAPVAVPGVQNVVAIAAGGGFSVALLADGTVMTWGTRFEGALGRTPTNDHLADPIPALVPGVKGVRKIVAGSAHVLALTQAGTVISWGQPDFGAVGRGDGTNPAPLPIPGLAGVQSIAASGSTSVAVLASGRIMTWGDVRPWTRPPEEGSYDNISRRPILLWLDGLEQP